MDRRLNGINPLAYIGVNPYTPPELVLFPRPPTPNDVLNFYLGTIWIDTGTNKPPTANDIWMLVSIVGNVATWINFASAGDLLTLTGDVGGPVPGDPAHNINILGANGIHVVGNPATHTLTITTAGGHNLLETLTGNVGGPVPADVNDNINIVGVLGINITGNPFTNTLTVGTAHGHNLLETLTGDAGGAVPADANDNINTLGTAGHITVTGNPGTNTLTWDLDGSIADQYPTDAGTAIPVAGVLNILGDGGSISTTGAGNTVTIHSTVPSYSTGLFTPSLNFGGAAVGITYSRQNGAYTKIGDTVLITIDILLTSKGVSAGNATVIGLPFAAAGALADQDLFMTGLTDITYPGGGTVLHMAIFSGMTVANINTTGSGVNITTLTDANFANDSHFKVQGSYFSN